MTKLFHDLSKTRKNDQSMVVLFYAPNCGHCKLFEKLYKQAAVNLAKKKGKKLKFFKANCQKNPNLIIAFKIKFFPYLVYFHDGLPKKKMPLLLTNSKGLTQQWIDMIDQKFHKQPKSKVKRANKHKKSLASEMKAIDQEYASIVGLASTGYSKYQKQLKNVLFSNRNTYKNLAETVQRPKPGFQFSSGYQSTNSHRLPNKLYSNPYTQYYAGED
jgi:thioredoxin-like negative regulator of GroEL